jgi:hypothetical protein
VSSPFNKGKGGTATKAAPAKAAPATKGEDDPTKADVTNLGEDKPIKKTDPFNATDPSGISGYKPIFFMGQLVLMHPTETGMMKTSANTADNPESEYVRFDIIPLTRPEAGEVSKSCVVDSGEVFTVLNKDGDPETCEPYEVGERIDGLLVFNKPLVREGKNALEKGHSWLLGRITHGTKKANQSAPVILVAGDEEDKAIYQSWRAAATA